LIERPEDADRALKRTYTWAADYGVPPEWGLEPVRQVPTRGRGAVPAFARHEELIGGPAMRYVGRVGYAADARGSTLLRIDP
jgi:hypothetical protein